MIENVVFDLGNVLLEFTPEKIVDNYVLEENKKEKVYNNIFNSKEWIMLDKGTISQKEATRRFINRQPDNKNEIIEIMNNWISYLKPINENISVLKDLADKEINLYVLSNFHRKAFLKVKQKYDFFAFFDGKVISFQVSTIKPEEEIYKILISKYNLTPQNTLFIDDSINNIKAANKLQFQTIHFDYGIDLESEVSRFLS